MRFVAFAMAATILGLWLVAREVRTEPPHRAAAALRRADLTALAHQVARVEPGALERVEPALPALPTDPELDDEPYEDPDPSEPPIDLTAYEAYGEIIIVTGSAPIIDTSTVTCGGPAIVDVVLAPIPLPPPEDGEVHVDGSDAGGETNTESL
jgi:hypothetical protein